MAEVVASAAASAAALATVRPSFRLDPPKPARDGNAIVMPRSAAARSKGANG